MNQQPSLSSANTSQVVLPRPAQANVLLNRSPQRQKKNMWPLCELKVSARIESNTSYITSEGHLHFPIFQLHTLGLPVCLGTRCDSWSIVCFPDIFHVKRQDDFKRTRKRGLCSKRHVSILKSTGYTIYLKHPSRTFWGGTMHKGQLPCRGTYWDGEKGELVHRASALKLAIQWTSLDIKSHWSCTKELLQIRCTKAPLWEPPSELMSIDTYSHTVFFPGFGCTTATTHTQTKSWDWFCGVLL